MLRSIICSLLLLIVVTASAQQDCKVAIQTQAKSSWVHDEFEQTLFDGFIHNTGSTPLVNITLSSSATFESIWALDADGGEFYLPHWRNYAGGVLPGKYHQFGYVVQGSEPAEFTVSESFCDTQEQIPYKDLRSSGKNKGHSPTPAPTHKPTKAPATKAASTTHAPATSKAATSAPTAKSGTSAPAAPGGRVCPAGSWWAPAPLTTYQWQLTGTIDTSVNVQMYDIDMFDNTAATIAELHSQGRVVICYISTQYENWRPDASSWTAAVLGNDLDDWAGEKWVDIRSTVVRNILTARFDLALSKGCDGIEPDNVDGYESNTGFPLTAADQIDFNTFIAEQCHARGLSVGLKNDVDQSSSLEQYFDWALDEQCYEYSECDTLKNFISAGKAVFNCEYSGSASSICPYMVGLKFTSLLKPLSLTATINTECCTYQSGGCAAIASHTCKSS